MINLIERLDNLSYDEIIFIHKNLSDELKTDIINLFNKFDNVQNDKVIENKNKLIEILKEDSWIEIIKFYRDCDDEDDIDHGMFNFNIKINETIAGTIYLKENDKFNQKLCDFSNDDYYVKMKYDKLSNLIKILNTLIEIKLIIEPGYGKDIKFQLNENSLENVIDFDKKYLTLTINNPYFKK